MGETMAAAGRDLQDGGRAADTDEVRVPAVLGFAESREVAELSRSLFLPRGVLVLASNTASMLRTLPHAPGEPRLVYRVTTSADQIVEPIAALVRDVLEPRLRREPGLLGRDEPVRLASVRYDNVGGQERADRLSSRLRLNGRTLVENRGEYREIVASPTDRGEANEAPRIAAEIAAYRPHLVIVEVDYPLVEVVERAWPEGARARPLYLGHIGEGSGVLEAIARRPDLARRVFPIDASIGTNAVAKLVLRHNRVFDRKITAATGNSAPYDAFYTLAYAAAALGPEPITGKNLARAIPRLLPPGAPIDVGPGGIFDAFNTLAGGKNIDLQGTITTLDFDLETGDPPTDFSVFCVGAEGHSESGLVYRARSGKFEGTWRCPGGR
jgi:branched-chain amino acid transport system substrate-binding protein